MSKFVKISTEFRELSMVKQSLDELKIAYEENAQFVHIWSGFKGKVPLVVKQRGAKFGLRPTAEGAYEVIGDDMEMAGINRTVAQVQQRYAYHKVLAETARAGFSLVEEKVGADDVIRLTVRRWS